MNDQLISCSASLGFVVKNIMGKEHPKVAVIYIPL